MICSTPAFVLRAYDFRETSKIAVFFSRDFGKVKGILKGIRTDPKKFGSTLPLLSLNHIVFYRKRTSDIHLVGQCDLLDDFALHRGALTAFGSAGFVAELAQAILPLEDANGPVFALLSEFLASLKESPERTDLRLLFLIKFLALSGFKPHLDSCVSCEESVAGRAYFSHARGGLLCAQCLFHDETAEIVLPGTVASILYLEKTPWSACLRLNMLSQVRREIDAVLSAFLRFHVGKSLKSDAVLKEIAC